MALVLRTVKGSELTWNELDGNFTYLTGSLGSSLSSSLDLSNYATTIYLLDGNGGVLASESITYTTNAYSALIAGSAGSANSATTADYANNTLIFDAGGYTAPMYCGFHPTYGAYDTSIATSSIYFNPVTNIFNLSSLISLPPIYPLPSVGISAGTFAVSSSTPPKPYFYDGTTWNALY